MKLSSEYIKKLIEVINPEKSNLVFKHLFTKQQYKIFMLRYDDDYNVVMSIYEIAENLNISRQAVDQNLNKIYTKIIKHCKLVHPNHPLSKPIPSRKEQIIQSIHELRRLPHEYTKDNKPEKTFIESGVNQKFYYNKLRTAAKKANKKLEQGIKITQKEKQYIDDLNEIEKLIKYYEEHIELSEYAKQLIETIHIIHRLPKKEEFVFSDGRDQRMYYASLLNTISSTAKVNRSLTKMEKQKIVDYYAVIKVLKLYRRHNSRNLSRKEKKDQIIERIKTTHHILRANKKEEDTFTNGAVMQYYYKNLRVQVAKLKEESKTRELTEEEYALINDLKEIDETIERYCNNIEEKEKKLLDKIDQLIKIINSLQGNPIAAKDDEFKQGTKFIDGTDSRNLYDRLSSLNSTIKKKINNNEKLTEKEILIKEQYKIIRNALSFYPQFRKDKKEAIENLCHTFNIDIKKNQSLYKKSAGELYSKMMFLIENNIPLTNNEGLVHEIMYMSDLNMQEKYHISLEEILNKYINGKENIKEIVKK